VVTTTSSRPPRPAKGHAVERRSLRPEDAFLLSRIDGERSEAELAALTGQGLASVKAGIARLVALGAVLIDSHPPPPPSDPPRQVKRSDPVPSDQPIDLEPEFQRRIDELFDRLETADFYGLLGLSPDADVKAVKKAYYGSAPAYHPDRYYGKSLGPYKAKMEAIFGRLTIAYDTLKSKETRAEYDAYVATQHETQRLEQLLGDQDRRPSAKPPSFPPDDRLEESPKASPVAFPAATPAPAVSAPARQQAAPQRGRASMPPPRTPEQDQARREAFAKGSGRPPAASDSGRPPARPVNALEELKRRHDAAMVQAGGLKGKVRQYFEAAGQAAAANNPAAAANAYRLALDLEPDNPVLKSAYEAAAKVAAVALAGSYLKQAEYEARCTRWADAAHSYVHAFAGMPDNADVAFKAASALVKASGDLRQAANYAAKAIALEPKKLEPRLLLVDILLMAGKPNIAKRELEAAREIAPQDEKIKELSKRLR